VVELKREIVEGKGGKEGKGYSILGLHSIPTFILHFIFLLLCSLHLPKASKVNKNCGWKGERWKIKYANRGRRAENEMRDNNRFILLARASSKTISILEDLVCRCD
jgi:hypothetical protein